MKITTIKLNFTAKKNILAVGGNAKNTVCLLKGDTAYISPVYKNLDDPVDFYDFSKAVARFLKEKPTVIAHDLHPNYPSTVFINSLTAVNVRRIAVQHHHAHIASCMAENNLGNETVIGIAFDGTGLGLDGMFWGAEVFICDYTGFSRVAHLKEVPLAGGERAIREPWRSACYWLSTIYDDRFLKLGIPFTKSIKADRWRVVKQMLSKQVNSPFASSMGRLFDAAASIILAKKYARFEAELAIEMETAAAAGLCHKEPYRFRVEKRNGHFVFDPQPLFAGIITDIKRGVSRQEIACRFHQAIAKMALDACRLAACGRKLEKVVLSGGVFQNNILLKTCLGLLYKEGFRVLIHRELSCSDAGISLGQAAVARFQKE